MPPKGPNGGACPPCGGGMPGGNAPDMNGGEKPGGALLSIDRVRGGGRSRAEVVPSHSRRGARGRSEGGTPHHRRGVTWHRTWRDNIVKPGPLGIGFASSFIASGHSFHAVDLILGGIPPWLRIGHSFVGRGIGLNSSVEVKRI